MREVMKRRQRALAGIGTVEILGIKFQEDPAGQRLRREMREEDSTLKSLPRRSFF